MKKKQIQVHTWTVCTQGDSQTGGKLRLKVHTIQYTVITKKTTLNYSVTNLQGFLNHLAHYNT